MSNKRFLPHTSLPIEISQRLGYLEYFRILAAIPTLWKIELRNNNLHSELDFVPKVVEYSDSTQVSRRIYWDQVEHRYPVTPGIKLIWQSELKKRNLQMRNGTPCFQTSYHIFSPLS